MRKFLGKLKRKNGKIGIPFFLLNVSQISKNMKTYPKVSAGEKFKARRDIKFSDGTTHTKDQVYTATDETKSYFAVNIGDYIRLNVS